MNSNQDETRTTVAAGNNMPPRRNRAGSFASVGSALLRRNSSAGSGGGFVGGMPSLRRNSSAGAASAAAAAAASAFASSGNNLHDTSDTSAPKPKKRNSLTSLSQIVGMAKHGSSTRRGSGNNFENSAACVGRAGDGKTYSVYDLVERRKWKRLGKFLDTPEGRQQVIASISKEELLVDEDNKDQSYTNHDGTALHHAVSQGAPLEIVRAVGEAGGPSLWTAADSGGRTALHVAAFTTNREDNDGVVVHLLTLSRKASANIATKDADGRTALHLACMERPPRRSSGLDVMNDGNNDPPQDVKTRKISPSVIRALADAAPAAIRIEDAHGLTPLDLATMTVTDLDGKFCPASKPSARILSEVAICPMIRHCHALWSKRTTENDDDDVQEEEEAFLCIERAEWTRRRSSAVRSAIQAHKLKERNAQQQQRRRRSEGARTLDESLHHRHLHIGGMMGGVDGGSRRRSETMMAASPASGSANEGYSFGAEQLVMRVQDFKIGKHASPRSRGPLKTTTTGS